MPSASVASYKEYGSVAVSIPGMAISDADKDLLPAWARFVRGVVDAPSLQPTASREAVHQDESFQAVRRLLAGQLGAGLEDLAGGSPEVWRRIVHGHGDVIMGWAAKDASFFRMVAEVVPLRTTRGRIPIPAYLRMAANLAYFTTRELGSLQDKVLAEGRDVPAIDASWFPVPSFLENYATLHPEVELVRLDDDLRAILRPAPIGDFGELSFVAEVSSFKPADFPAVMTYPAGAEAAQGVAASIAEKLFPEGFSGLMQGYLDGQGTAASSSFHRGMALLEDLRRRDSICPEGVAAYYEAGGDLEGAIGGRDREFAEVATTGMLHRSGQIRIERCRLLDRAGRLAPADLEAVRAQADGLQLPGWYREKLRRLETSGRADG